MIFRSICFEVIEAEPFKYFFCNYFKVIHDFIEYRGTFLRRGIISKVHKVRNIVLKKQITKTYVNPIQDGPFRSCSEMGKNASLSLKSVAHVLQ